MKHINLEILTIKTSIKILIHLRPDMNSRNIITAKSKPKKGKDQNTLDSQTSDKAFIRSPEADYQWFDQNSSLTKLPDVDQAILRTFELP